MALQEPNRHSHGQHKKYKAFSPPPNLWEAVREQFVCLKLLRFSAQESCLLRQIQ